MGTQLRKSAVDLLSQAKDKKRQNNRPTQYRVILLNDDYTPMDFVVLVLQRFFEASYSHAVKIMLEIHHNQRAVCGVYTRDIAETKVAQVIEFARRNEHPLLCKIEKVHE